MIPTLNYFYDLEFLEDGQTIELISIGIVCEDDREYYAVNSEMPIERIGAHDWLCKNVVGSLPLRNKHYTLEQIERHKKENKTFYDLDSNARNVLSIELDTTATCVKPKFVIANEVRDFLLLPRRNGNGNSTILTVEPEFWAYYGAYDYVGLCQLWGPMIRIPDGMPYYTNNLKSLRKWLGDPEIPSQVGTEHNALDDARYNREVYNMLASSKS